MFPLHRYKTVVSEDGKLILDNIPFQAGDAVEVYLIPDFIRCTDQRPLAGTVLRYDRPTDPVGEDWDAEK